jgi:hypothetical protein
MFRGCKCLDHVWEKQGHFGMAPEHMMPGGYVKPDESSFGVSDHGDD